jgi:hypothetical protein
VPTPASPPRFLSQDEEPEDTVEAEDVVESEDEDGPIYYSATASSANVAAAESEIVESDRDLQREELEPEAIPSRPKFAELSEEPAYTPPPSEYVETNVETQPDLDKPTFLRRLGF